MMNIYSDEFYKIAADVECNAKATQLSVDKIKFDFAWNNAKKSDGAIKIMFSVPCTGIEGIWEPTCLNNRNYNLRQFETTAMGAVPLLAYYNNAGNSIFAIALSDAVNKIKYFFAINERTAEMDCTITIDLKQFGEKNTYSITLYTQREELPIYEMCENVSDWWEEFYDTDKLIIPDKVKNPCYSTWYAYHHDFSAQDIIEECKRAKEYGMDMVILDDGWQTDDRTFGMKYVGDYRPSGEKIPNMRKMVSDIHALGMKFLLWYSTSFVGFASEQWDKFKDKIISTNDRMQVGVLDPRYPEVREHMINLYINALKDWDLDGFKLDFIDSYRAPNPPEMKDGMDYNSIEEAVDVFITDAITALRAIKDDVIIEFRQGYVGPNMRRFATIFRVTDCPEDYRFNRLGIADLRMTAGKTVIQSDMLMFNKNDTPEVAALQILNAIFSVIQFSVKINTMSADLKKMTKFWLNFAKMHRNLLVEGQIKPQEVNNFYPIIKTEDDAECITAVYEINKIVNVDLSKKNYIINACDSERLVIDTDIEKEMSFESYDCMGNLKDSGKIKLNPGVNVVCTCRSGLLIFDE